MYTLGFFYMRRNIFFISFFLFLASFLMPQTANAQQQKQAGSSAAFFESQAKPGIDKRAKTLKSYLETNNSPLAPYTKNFIIEADKYRLDWRLVASISGVESTFGKQLPYNSYNAWGWGIYGDNVHYFKSYDEAIHVISKGLRENYINKWGAKDVYQIGDYYAADPNWAGKVSYFMNKIDKYELENSKETLPLSL